MKRFLSICMLFVLYFCNSYAQTFTCSDIKTYDKSISARRIQEGKTKMLGTIVELSFYDKSVKYTQKVDGKTKTFVLDKENDTKYSFSIKQARSTRRIELVLHKTMGYITSFTLYAYENGSLETEWTYKRNMF